MATGKWSLEEKKFDINALETKAVYLGLNIFAQYSKGVHARLCSDCKTTVAYINKNTFVNKVWQLVLQGKG